MPFAVVLVFAIVPVAAVVVDLTASADCGHKAFRHNLKIRVARQIEVVPASVSNWEPLVKFVLAWVVENLLPLCFISNICNVLAIVVSFNVKAILSAGQ